MYKTYILQQMLLDALFVNGITTLYNSEIDNDTINRMNDMFYKLYKESSNKKPTLKKMIKFKLL